MSMIAMVLTILIAEPESRPAERLTVKRAEWKERFDEANVAFKAKKIADAEEKFRVALAAARQSDEPEQAAAFVLNGLVASLIAQQKFEEAEDLAVEAIELWRRRHGGTHPTVGRSLSNLGNIRAELGKYPQAVKDHNEALRVLETTRERSHPEVLHAAERLAEAYFDLGADDKAISVYRNLFVVHSQAATPSPAAIARILNRLARCQLRRGEAAAAEPLARQALQICQRQLGPQHPLASETAATLAWVYSAQGDAEKAMELIEQATQLLDQTTADESDHWQIEAIRTTILLRAKRYEEAIESTRRAETLAPERPRPVEELARLHENAAKAYQELGRESDAKQRLENADRIRQSLRWKAEE